MYVQSKQKEKEQYLLLLQGGRTMELWKANYNREKSNITVTI